MPVLANPKHEAFARSIADGIRTVDAYEIAGYNRSPSAASQLKGRPEVLQRIQEIISEKQSIAANNADDIDNLPNELTRDWLVKTLMKNVQLAQNVGQIAPANKAVEMLAELIGYSFKKPGGATPANDESETGKKEESFDMDRLSSGMANLGKILDRKDEAAKP